jgi:hypothetical protein
MIPPDREPCPACGGAGGGPFGRANSAWDVESYECVRCGGWGYIREAEVPVDAEPPAVARPGLAKTAPDRAPADEADKSKRKSG